MRRAVYSLLLFLLASPAFAQTCQTGWSSVQASKIIDLSGNLLASGTLAITGVDANRNIINFGAPGGGAVMKVVRKAPVSNGAIVSTVCVPRSDMATVYVRYHIVVTDNSASGTNAVVIDANDVPITANVFSLDAYPFPANAYSNPPNVFTSGQVDGDLHVTGTLYAGTIEGATAANADHATTADTATNANHATSADSATTATTANLATTATNATHATSADSATNAATANAFSATPANCGSEAINGINADGSPNSCIPVGVVYPATNGLVFNTSTTSARNATGTDINAVLGYTPATGPNFTSDFIACYLFLEAPTSGGTLVDHCGSNNGTIGATAPVSTGTYWQFTNFVTSPVVLPAALNGAKTFYFAIQVPPAVAGSFNASQFNTLLGGTVAGSLDINASPANGAGFQTYGGFSAFSGGGASADSVDVFSGVAILTLVCGTPDTLYINGHKIVNLASGSTSCGKTTSGSYEIGDSADSFNFSAFAGFYDLRVSNNQHTPAQVAQNVAALYNELVGRGVSLVPNRYTYPSQQLFFAGDSITCGYNAGGSPACTSGTPWVPGTASSNAYTNHLVLDQTFGIQNFGVTSAQVQQQVAAAPVLYAPLCNAQSGNTIAVLFEGTNNNGANTAAQTWSYAAGWTQMMHGYGCKTVYIDMLSRGATAGGTTYESFKTQLDTQARTNWKQAGFDGFIDMEADPFLGCSGCYSNTTYFTGDQIHPTAAGQLKLALAVQATINYLSAGSTPANPNPTVVTAATHTSIYEDGGLVFDTAANNIVDTLTSAQWMTGRIISRCNNSTAGTNTLTITAPSDYPFNNITGNTTVGVPNNTCQKFQAIYIAGTPNGDYWRLVQ